MLTEARFRTTCLAKTPNAEVRAYFESRYDKASEPMKATARESILNNISPFTAEPRFRHIVGQALSTFSIKESMDCGRIVIAHVPKGELGGQALTFASLLFTVVKNAIFTRDRKAPYTLFLNEAQNFASQSTDVETVLSEASKFGVGIVAANQFLDPVSASLLPALLAFSKWWMSRVRTVRQFGFARENLIHE